VLHTPISIATIPLHFAVATPFLQHTENWRRLSRIDCQINPAFTSLRKGLEGFESVSDGTANSIAALFFQSLYKRILYPVWRGQPVTYIWNGVTTWTTNDLHSVAGICFDLQPLESPITIVDTTFRAVLKIKWNIRRRDASG